MSFETIKQTAAGRCVEIIVALTSIDREIGTAKKDINCPLCDHGSLHADRRDDGVNQHGKVRCHHCLDAGTGDIIDTVRVFGGHDSQGSAAKAVADYLGLSASEATGAKPIVDIIEAVAKAKRMPLDAFRQFGPKVDKRGRNQKPVARVPVYNESGEIHSHFDLTPTDKGFFKRGDGSQGLFLPGRLPKAGETWHLVEGVKDAAALVGLGFDACGLPSSFMAPKYARLFQGVHVVTVADLDQPGQNGAQRTGGNLAGVAASVKVARLPGEIVASKGEDVRDVIRRHGEQAVRDAIAAATEWQPRDGEIFGKDSRPEEILTLRYAWHVDRVIGHLGQLGWKSPWLPEAKRETRKLYQRGGVLVDVVTESKADATAKGGQVKIAQGTPRLRVLPTSQLSLRIADACQLIVEKEKDGDIEKQAVPPPKWLIDGIHTAGDYGGYVRHLEAIVTAPTIRPDGSVLQKPGWDASGLLFRPSMKFEPIPDEPSQSDAVAATEKLFEVVADFPFTDAADKAAWLAMLLSMIGRPCVTGHVPMFAVTANIRGAGKSLLVDAASIIAYGHSAARTAYASDDDEMRKRITAVIMEGSPAVLLDNIDRPIGGASLDAVLTAERWKDRELGSSRTIDLPARAVWTATGNNLRFRSDVARRVVPIRLDSPEERPELRTDFRHNDLLGWTREHRGELVTAALTILRAYFVAGCPKQDGGQFGSFETWSDVIRGAVVWAGCSDPMDTIETAQADDDSAAIVAGLIGGLLEIDDTGDGMTCREIIDRLNDAENAGRFPAMREVVAEVGMKGGRPDVSRLGYAMRKYRGRVCNGYRIAQEQGHAKQNRWFAKPASIGGHGGHGSQVEESETGDVVGESGGHGGHGGHGFPPPIRETCCVATQHAHDTHTPAYRDGPESCPTSPPSPPHRKVPCPKCGGAMTPAEPVDGWRNWDCQTPGCGHVKPMREGAAQ
ncbi:hypothetical protein Mal15_38190 [Stieleria maiorica]|uniref:Zinc-binding domain of primase-helicase n=1 Tax=Stieleria maiorica TaxID=2795974 RepID=A0A5B9MFY2_9BACT|nr:hypothetical protein [Stieleria maiorica]QEF99753.1 hypothetical protein Mal15_38190 [Stieleria maiorica]